MNKKVDAYIVEHKDELISELSKFIKIPSKKDEPAGKNAPFGADIRAALDCIMNTAKGFGFDTCDMDGYVGCVDFGEGEELLGIMCHVDVVPEGDATAWKYPPYSATIVDDVMYSRGTLDDKGPAMAALFAMAAVKASGLRMKRRVKLILGCDEESGWGCMEHYKKHGEMPHIAFSPDAEYPLVYSEKGILRMNFKKQYKSSIRFTAGACTNAVADKAEIFVPIDAEKVNAAIEMTRNELANFPITCKAVPGGTEILVVGKIAHAANNENGFNAIQAGLTLLSSLHFENAEDENTVKKLHMLLKLDRNGESMKIDYTDESGRLTVNAGIMRWNEDGISEFTLDMRVPLSIELQNTFDWVSEMMAAAGLEVFDSELKNGHLVPRDSELVTKLLQVYAERTGIADPQPLAIGGGTYARALDNAVAFGCEVIREGVNSPVHEANEFISIEDLLFNTYMIADAIVALACEE